MTEPTVTDPQPDTPHAPNHSDAIGPPVSDPGGPTRRLVGPDVVRAVAMAGVVIMNYHGYLVHQGAERSGGWWYGWFDPWRGPLSTRFAAAFVVTAGVGITLLTNRAGHDPVRRSDVSWRLARRGLLLYGGGLVFDQIWSGTILPYYGGMFVLAAVLWRLASWTLAVIGVGAAVASWSIHEWVTGQLAAGADVAWLTDPSPRSPMGLVYNLFVNGTHPLFPWLAFLCAGIIVGRVVTDPDKMKIVLAVGTTLWLVAMPLGFAATDGDIALSPHPFDRGMVYTASALGTALIAFVVICAVAERVPSSAPISILQRAGQLSLTIYIGHALVFNLVVNQLGWVRPGGLSIPLVGAAVYWLLATAAGSAFQSRFGRGPAEWLYRKLTA